MDNKFHTHLNPKLWDWWRDKRPGAPFHYELKTEVAAKLKDIADAFIESIGINRDAIKDIVITGSSASYNYTPQSDIDLHLLVDTAKVHKDCPIVDDFLISKKSEFNDKHDIYIYGIPVEVYAENYKNENIHNGLYSLVTNSWIDEPKKLEPVDNDAAVAAKYKEIVSAAKGIADKDEATKLIDKIKKMRKAGLAKNGEFSVENLVFKKLRNDGTINKLMQTKKEGIDKELSLEENLSTIYENLIDEAILLLEKWGNNSGRYTNGTLGINDDSEDKKYIGNSDRSVSYKDREMSPDKYIQACSRMFKGNKRTPQSFVNKVEGNRAENREKIEKLKNKIKSDTEQVDIPYIDYQIGRQEGLHRAIAAKELGMEKIPVRVFHSTDKGANKKFRKTSKREASESLINEILTCINELEDKTVEDTGKKIWDKLNKAQSVISSKQLYKDIDDAVKSKDEKKYEELQKIKDDAIKEVTKRKKQLETFKDLNAKREERKTKEREAIEKVRNQYQDPAKVYKDSIKAGEDHSNAELNQGLRKVLDKLYNKDKAIGATYENLIDCIEEMMGINTGIAGMMDRQPIGLAGQRQPSYSKEGKGKQKSMCKYNYNRVMHKSKNVQ